MKLRAVGFAALAMLLSVGQAKAVIINGDFQAGDLTGWTTFATLNGSLGTGMPTVVPFDTTNDGTVASAKFQVGQTAYQSGVLGGGGIYQDALLYSGDLTISANIAAAANPFANADGALFELLFDGLVVDSYDFGAISRRAVEHSLLASISGVAAGPHEVRVRMTRPWITKPYTPVQYINNVVLSGSATIPEVLLSGSATIPEPASVIVWSLLGLTGAWLCWWRGRRRAAEWTSGPREQPGRAPWSEENRAAILEIIGRSRVN